MRLNKFNIWPKIKKKIDWKDYETVEQYLQRGGKITKVPSISYAFIGQMLYGSGVRVKGLE